MIKKLQAKGNSGKEEIFQRVMFGRAKSHEIEDFFLRKIQESMHDFECVWTDVKEMTEEPLYPITKISLMEKIIRVEMMQQISLLKGSGQAFMMNCRCFSLKGQFLNVVKL